MAIQPFATQIQPPQIQPVNAMAQVGQLMAMRNAQQENQLRQLQTRQLEQGIAQENALREYLSGADLSTPEARQGLVRYGTPGLEAQRALQQAEAASLQTASAQQQLITDRLKSFKEIQKGALTPEDRLALHDAVHADRLLGPYLASMGATADRGRAQIINAAKTPDSWQSFLVQSDLGLDKLIDLGFRQQQERRAESAETRAQSAERRAQSAEERAKDEEDRKRKKFKRETAAENLGTYNEKAGGFISEITGKLTPLSEATSHPAAKAATKTLKTLGYDEKTGSSLAVNLIKNSTGTAVGNLLDFVAAQTLGVTLAGAENIARLKAMTSQATLDVLEGRLGAGISEGDRQMVVQLFADAANPNIPRGAREAAMTDAINRLTATKEAGAAGVKGKVGGASTQKPAVRSGVTRSGVKFTVEED